MANSAIKGSMKIDGLSEMLSALRQLPVELQEKELSNAAAKGAIVMRNEAQRRAPVLDLLDLPVRSSDGAVKRFPGLLKRSIVSTRGVRRSYEAAAFLVIKRLSRSVIRRFKEATGRSARENPNDPFYWRFVEFGTSKMEARPFLRSTFMTKKEEATAVMADELAKGIGRAAAKLGRTIK